MTAQEAYKKALLAHGLQSYALYQGSRYVTRPASRFIPPPPDKRSKELESIILTDPEYCCYYAKHIIRPALYDLVFQVCIEW